MKRRTRTTEIRIETEEVYLLRTARPKQMRIWCAACAAEVQMFTADEAAEAAGVTARTIYRWAEGGKIHFAETPGGRLLVCANSLS